MQHIKLSNPSNKMEELLNSNESDFGRPGAVVHWNLAQATLPGQHTMAARIPVFHSRPQHGALWKHERRWKVFLHKKKVGCTDFTLLEMWRSPYLEPLIINCKPFYSPREFSLFTLVGVYIPPQACVTEALQQLAEQITDVEKKTPRLPAFHLGGF